MQEVLQVLGSLLMVATGFIYLNQVKNNQSTPNPGTWGILFIVLGLNAATYLTVVDNNYFKAIIVIVSFLVIGAITIYSLIKGKFSVITGFDKLVLIISLLVGVLWQITDDARLSNILMQLIIFLTFIPIVRGLWCGYLKEKMLPWNLAVVAYTFQMISLLMDFQGDYLQLCYPFINGVLGNGLIPIILIIKKAK